MEVNDKVVVITQEHGRNQLGLVGFIEEDRNQDGDDDQWRWRVRFIIARCPRMPRVTHNTYSTHDLQVIHGNR